MDMMWSNWPIGTLRSATRLQHRMYAFRNVSAVQMSLYTITADYNGPLEAAHYYSVDDRYDLVALDSAGQQLSDQLWGCSIVCTHVETSRQGKWAYTITANYKEPLEAVHCYSDDDRYNLVAWGTASPPQSELSDQLRLRDCSIACTHVHKSAQCKVLLHWL